MAAVSSPYSQSPSEAVFPLLAQKEASEVANSSFNPPVLEAFQRALKASFDERGLKKLPREMQGKIQALSHKIDEFIEAVLPLCILQDELSVLSNEQLSLLSADGDHSDELTAIEEKEVELDKAIEEKEKEIESFVKHLVSEYKDLGVCNEWVSDLRKLERIPKGDRDISVKIYKERLLNRVTDRHCFLEQAIAHLELKKEDIIAAFCPQDLCSLDPSRVTFKLCPKNSETHNRGKVAIRVSAQLDGKEIFQIFYKPRDARIDAQIIRTFATINELDICNKSSIVDLPNYKILNFIEENSRFSVWEFIDGEHKVGLAVNDFVKGLTVGTKKASLTEQLFRLQSVCKFLSVSDLHTENLLFSGLKTDEPKIIPIDLESIQPGCATGLFSEKEPDIDLKPEEIEVLELCKSAINSELVVRFIPVETSSFLGGLTKVDSFVYLTQSIITSLETQGFILETHRSELEWLVLMDFIHNDVSYMTINQSEVNYVQNNRMTLLARRPS